MNKIQNLCRAMGVSALVAASLSIVGGASPAQAAAPDNRPNIVFITTDDMRADDLQYMPHTRRLLGGKGMKFNQALSPHPLCCPARAEWMSGQYAQNNGVHHNTGAHGGYSALVQKNNNVGRWLQVSGYKTAMVGKFMNGYKEESIGGWNIWNAATKKDYAFFGTGFMESGTSRAHHDKVTTKKASQYIRQFSNTSSPFFVWASALSPHKGKKNGKWVQPLANKKHRDTYNGLQATHIIDNPTFGVRNAFDSEEAVDGDKPAKATVANTNHANERRAESLRVVDDGVKQIVKTLRRTGEMQNTYVVFTSDNGYLLGEHDIYGKNYLYPESLTVPMLVRGPGIQHGSTSNVPVTAVDIAPTFADFANTTPQRVTDGTSFKHVLNGGTQWRDAQLIQTGSNLAADGKFLTRGVMDGTYLYRKNENNGKEQVYDLSNDRYMQADLSQDEQYGVPQMTRLRAIYQTLKNCSGSNCR